MLSRNELSRGTTTVAPIEGLAGSDRTGWQCCSARRIATRRAWPETDKFDITRDPLQADVSSGPRHPMGTAREQFDSAASSSTADVMKATAMSSAYVAGSRRLASSGRAPVEPMRLRAS